MTTTTKKKRCKKCTTDGRLAAVLCKGCQCYFCVTCIVQHRQELAAQITNVVREHESLRQQLDQKCDAHTTLKHIDEWEQVSMAKIQASATAARAEVQRWADRKKSQAKPLIDKVAEELDSCRKSNEFPESDVDRWIEQLTELREVMENRSNIDVGNATEATAILHLIQVRESRNAHQSLVTSVHECFGAAVGAVSLSDDGRRAAHLDHVGSNGSTCGVTLYSSGAHRIRFRIAGDWGRYFFVGILTSLQEMTSRACETPSAYGWWDFETRVVNGEADRRGKADFIERDDELSLTIDCDRRQIQLTHDRTNTKCHLSIDLQVCPFPWKFLVGFDWRGGCVQLLH